MLLWENDYNLWWSYLKWIVSCTADELEENMRICSEVDVLVKGKIVKNNKCDTQSNDDRVLEARQWWLLIAVVAIKLCE